MSYLADSNRYQKMHYNRCGRSGLKLPALSLGLWHNFGGVDVYENAKAVLLRSFDLGITHFDLANNYGPPAGSAETTFGQVLKEGLGQYRDELVISTKAGYYMWEGPYGEWGSRKYMMSSLDQSLKRMDLDYVDVFYSHRMDPDTPLEETMTALSDAVKMGKALYVGISNYSPEMTREAARILRELGTPCLIHQPRYSMLVRQPETEGLFGLLQEEGIGCINFSPLAQGLLTNRYLDGIPEGSRATKGVGFLTEKMVTEEILDIIRRLNTIAEERGQTLAQMAIAWCLAVGGVTSVLVGASRVSQIEDSVLSLDNMEFSQEEIAAIDAILGT